nr:conjugative transfer relaxase/helicase TraI [Legionella anisa]
MSIKSIGQSQSAQHYYTSQDNYYLTDKDSLKDLSYWLGDGAKRLNLSGVVEPKPFLNLLNGELPNGQQLGIIKDGERKHRAGTDVTLSAPKSVSILGLVGQDKRIIEAHQKAVSITFKRIETLAAEARITFNKETTFEKTKNLTAASFLHTSSRELDPALHTHLVIMNMTERSDGQWRALSSRAKQDKEHLDHGFRELIYENQHYLGLVYTSTLAKEIKNLGFDIRIKDSFGNFEIEGVSDELIGALSKRREQIVNDMEARGFTSAKASEKSNLSTRRPKTEVDSQSLLMLWQNEVASLDVDLTSIIEKSKNKGVESITKPLQSPPLSANVREAVADALEHLSEYNTQIKHANLVRQAMSFASSLISHEEIEQEIKRLLEDQILSGQTFEYYTTDKLIAQEKDFIDCMKQNPKGSFALSGLNNELAGRVLGDGNRIQIIDVNGFSNEKSLIQDLVTHAEKHKLNPYVLHQGTFQAQILSEHIKRDSSGMFSWLKNLFKDDIVHTVAGFQNQHSGDSKSSFMTRENQDVVIIHDAQKLSFGELTSLNKLSLTNGCKLILLNNTAGIQGFSRGNPIKTLKENGLEALNSQTSRKSIEIELSIAPKNLDTMVSTWVQMPIELQKESTLIALNTKQTEEINQKVRAELMHQGHLSRLTAKIDVLATKTLTEIQKNRIDSYQIGDRITFNPFTRSQKHYDVKAKTKDSLILQNSDGTHREFVPEKECDFQMSRPKKMDIAMGERITNDRTFYHQRIKFEKGTDFIVTALSEEGIELNADKHTFFLDKATLSKNYFSYNYCKKLHTLISDSKKILVAAQPYQLNKNLIGELSEWSKKITLFTNNEVKAQKFLDKEEIKWTASEIAQKKPDLIYRDSAYADKAVEQDLSALIERLDINNQSLSKSEIARSAVNYAVAKCAERNAAFKHSDLMLHALKYALGNADFEDIAPILKERIASSNLMHLNTYWTTNDAIKLEENIIRANFAEQNTIDPIERNEKNLLSLPSTLTQGQKDAITLITTTKDRFVSIQGLAGVGKTTMMHQVQDIARKNQFSVIGLAPTHKAVSELTRNGLNARTIDSFLQNDLPIDSQTLLIVDESSMIDNSRYHALQKKAIEFNARIAFTGDITQLQSLSSGIPHELTIKSKSQKTAFMAEIVRQNPNPELKKAAQFASNRQIKEAFNTLNAIDPEFYVERQGKIKKPNASSIIEINCLNDGKKDYEPVYQAITDDYLSRTKECQKNTIVVVHAHEDRAVIDQKIRKGLQNQNQVSKQEQVCGRLVAKSLDKADSVLATSYKAGDILRFGKSYYVAKKDDYFQIKGINPEANTLYCESEDKVHFTIKATMLPKAQTSVYGYQECTLAAGDRVRLKKSDEAKGFTANKEYTVQQINAKSAILSDGEKSLELNLDKKSDQHWDYAYTNTAYSSQGATARLEIGLELEDRIVVTTHRSHEIDLTRASHQATIYTDNLEGLTKRLLDPLKQRDSDKTSALLTEQSLKNEMQKQKRVAASLKNSISAAKTDEQGLTEKATENKKSMQVTKQQKPVQADEVLIALNAQAESLVKHLLGEPNHNLSKQDEYRYGTKGSLTINLDKGLWHNFETGESGNLFHLIERELSLSGFKETLDYAVEFTNHNRSFVAVKPKQQKSDLKKLHAGMRDKAQELYRNSKPVKGTLAEKYLTLHRGLSHFEHADIRYCSSVFTTKNGIKTSAPALLAFARNEKGIVNHVQVTRLDKQTANKDKTCDILKQTYGAVEKYAVNLNQNGAGDTTYITEGVETGLSILEVNNKLRVFTVLGKQNFAKIDEHILTKNVVFCIDNDGDNTFKYDKNEPKNKIIQAVNRLKDLGFNVSIILPENKGYDLNDILKKEGKESLGNQLKITLTPAEFAKKCQGSNELFKEQFKQNNHDKPLNKPMIRPDFLKNKSFENIRNNYDFVSRIKADVMSSEIIKDLNTHTLNKANNPANFERERER